MTRHLLQGCPHERSAPGPVPHWEHIMMVLLCRIFTGIVVFGVIVMLAGWTALS